MPYINCRDGLREVVGQCHSSHRSKPPLQLMPCSPPHSRGCPPHSPLRGTPSPCSEETSIEKHPSPVRGFGCNESPTRHGQAHRQTDERKPAVPPPAPATVQNARSYSPMPSSIIAVARRASMGRYWFATPWRRERDRHLVHPRSAHDRHLLGDGRAARLQNSANSATSASVQYGTDHPIMASISSKINTLAPDAMNRLRALHLRKKNSQTEQMA